MAFTLSLQDVAIAAAIRAKTLRIESCVDRFGDNFIAIKDQHGTIEVADNHFVAYRRVMDIKMRLYEKKPGN